MRARRLRRVHDPLRRRTGPLVHHVRGAGRRPRHSAPWKGSRRRTARSARCRPPSASAHALQCGFCTPGILMTLTAFLRDTPSPTEAGDPRRAVGESLSMHRLPAHRRGGHALPARQPATLTRAFRGNEDARLLTGRARFVDDVQLPGMLHVAFVRSEYAHARIRAVDVTAARARPGVLAVYTAADLGDYSRPAPLLVPPPPIQRARLPRADAPAAGAPDKVRYVGEPIAIDRRGEPLHRRRCAARRDRRRSIRSTRSSISKRRWPTVRRGCTTTSRRTPRRMWSRRKGDYAAARAAGGRRHRATIPLRPRRVGGDREPRRRRRSGIASAEELTIWDTTQAPIPIRNGLAQHARPARVAGACRRAVRRRRLRSEDHDVLSGGTAACRGRRCGSAGRSSGPRIARRTSTRRRRSAGRCTTPRWRSRATAASSACATTSCSTPAPTIRTA